MVPAKNSGTLIPSRRRAAILPLASAARQPSCHRVPCTAMIPAESSAERRASAGKAVNVVRTLKLAAPPCHAHRVLRGKRRRASTRRARHLGRHARRGEPRLCLEHLRARARLRRLDLESRGRGELRDGSQAGRSAAHPGERVAGRLPSRGRQPGRWRRRRPGSPAKPSNTWRRWDTSRPKRT